MRWGVFVIALAIFLVMDQSFLQVLALGSVFPGVCGTLVVYVAMFSPRSTSLWAAFICGLMLDLGSPDLLTTGQSIHVIGPYALGFTLGAYLVVLLRSIMVRRNPLTIAMLLIPCLLASSVVYLAIWSLRGFYTETVLPWGGVSLGIEMGRILGWILYSSVLAIPVGWLLLLSWEFWKFDPQAMRIARR
jgi:rod shape-determining protein MreD